MNSMDLSRFTEAQKNNYPNALSEIRNGRKTSHWMWYVFPQIDGLGRSSTAKFYAIKNLAEAEAYLQHPVLGKRLAEITSALLELNGKTASAIFGSPDDLKLRSSMTLFAQVKDADPVFQKVLDKYFRGKADELTLKLL